MTTGTTLVRFTAVVPEPSPGHIVGARQACAEFRNTQTWVFQLDPVPALNVTVLPSLRSPNPPGKES